MKTRVLIVLLLLSFLITGAQNVFETEYFFSADYYHTATNIFETNNNEYIVASTAIERGSNPQSQYLQFHKLDHKGNILITKTISTKALKSPCFLQKDNKLIYLSGVSAKTNENFVFFELDYDLNIAQEVSFSIPNYPSSEYHFSILDAFYRDSMQNEIIFGGKISPEENPYAFNQYLYRMNTNFDSLNIQIYIQDLVQYPMSIEKYPGRDSILMVQSATGEEKKIIVFNAESLLPTDTFFLPECENCYYNAYGSIKSVNDTAAVLGISFRYDEEPNSETLKVFSVDSQMNFTTETIIGNQENDQQFLAYPFSVSPEGNIYFGAVHYTLPLIVGGHNPSYFILCKFDPNMNIIWEQFYGGIDEYFLHSVYATKDGGCILSGQKWVYNDTTDEALAYILKVNADGNAPNGLQNRNHSRRLELLPYPNPGSTQLNIRTAVQAVGGTFNLYDIQGRMVLSETITDTLTPINTIELAPGSYIFQYVLKGEVRESGKWMKN